MCVTQSTPRIFTSPCVIVVLPAALSPTIPRMIGRCLVTGTPPYGLALVTAIRARVVRTISQSATSNLTLPQFHRLTQFGAGLGCIIECFAGGNHQEAKASWVEGRCHFFRIDPAKSIIQSILSNTKNSIGRQV